jgi:CheY-like chemotaxis protein
LLVDDEEDILDWLGPLLREQFVVVTSPSAAGALALFRAGMRFDVILCDVMMPVMTGIDLHDALTGELADYARRMIFMTGPIQDPSLRARFERLRNAWVGKPIDAEYLRAVIAERMAGRAAPPARSR